ncbi:MAG: (2Fe-2S)-binding protein, partial [Lautropia sp.]
FAVQACGSAVTTVEGLASPDGALGVLQRAFARHHALQCGFCTPGILVVLTDYLQRSPDPSDEEIRKVLDGNLCRCTGYLPIVRAVRAAVDELNGRCAASNAPERLA